jgi:HK97 family phage prohead protease
MKPEPRDGRERRTIDAEIRVAGDGGLNLICGYAAKYNSLSTPLVWVESGKKRIYHETINPGAFDDSIAADDVVALVDHEDRMILGRKSAGTLRLSTDTTGLLFEADKPETSYGNDLAVSIARGDIKQCSFGFKCLKDKWTLGEEGKLIRTLLKVQLLDVSPCTYPAYDDTEVALRSMQAWTETEAQSQTELQSWLDYTSRRFRILAGS